VVYTGAAPAGSGAQSYTWNGQNTAGQQQANGGTYTLTVSAADANGQAVNVSNAVQGAATAVEQVNGQTMITVGGVQVPVSGITQVGD
jgi:flagellar basal-body rod modification protein FlgD